MWISTFSVVPQVLRNNQSWHPTLAGTCWAWPPPPSAPSHASCPRRNQRPAPSCANSSQQGSSSRNARAGDPKHRHPSSPAPTSTAAQQHPQSSISRHTKITSSTTSDPIHSSSSSNIMSCRSSRLSRAWCLSCWTLRIWTSSLIQLTPKVRLLHMSGLCEQSGRATIEARGPRQPFRRCLTSKYFLLSPCDFRSDPQASDVCSLSGAVLQSFVLSDK